MNKTLNLIEAATAYLVDLEQPLVTDYQVGLFIFQAYQLKEFHNFPLRLNKRNPQLKDFKRVVQKLIDKEILSSSKEFPGSVFIVSNKPPVVAEEFVCLINPFTYISHFSAMKHHGFSEAPSRQLYLSAPSSGAYRNYIFKKMEKDCGGSINLKKYTDNYFPRLKGLEVDQIGNISVNTYHSKLLGAFKLKGNIRIATIERTFLDMLRKPDYCGGMKNVIQVYQKYALRHLKPVLKEIDTHGKQIEKVRAGYILEEYCKVKDELIENWLNFVQRGGSRKLDPFKGFASNYSERWCLSLNI